MSELKRRIKAVFVGELLSHQPLNDETEGKVEQLVQVFEEEIQKRLGNGMYQPPPFEEHD